jgi:hypothetical protein
MPPNKKAQSQVIVGEVVDRDTPIKPAGSPDLTPWHLATRRQRASFGPVMDAVTALTGPSRGVKAQEYTLSLNLGADLEDALVVMALNPPAARDWLQKAEDDDLMALFGWYMRQVEDDRGEATASRS